MKVLAVEDDSMSRFVLVSTLRSLAYDVCEAESCDSAWGALQDEPIRIIVADWHMPGADGLELCRRIRAMRREYIYFILLTESEASESNRRLADEAGVDDFLSKPIEAFDLSNRLRVAERILRHTVERQQLESCLPICGFCKKVRNDANYWEQIDQYVQKRTGTPLTYGVCPECEQRNLVSGQPSQESEESVSGQASWSAKRPSLKTIAEKAGVSSASVSMALRNHPRISAALRDKIVRIAAEVGYQPDPEMQKAMHRMRVTRKPGFKSVIYGIAPARNARRREFIDELVDGCQSESARRGYGFSTVQLSAGERPERITQMLSSRGVEGIAVLCDGTGNTSPVLDWSRFSVICAGPTCAARDFDAVRPNWFENVLRVHREMVDRRFARIGYVVSAENDAASGFRITAALLHVRRTQGLPIEPFIFSGVPIGERPCGGPGAALALAPASAFECWFERESPDAVVFDDEEWATAAVERLDGKLPLSKMAVLNRSRVSEFDGIVQQPFEIGSHAISILAGKIERRARGVSARPTVLKVTGCWTAGNALGATKPDIG